MRKAKMFKVILLVMVCISLILVLSVFIVPSFVSKVYAGDVWWECEIGCDLNPFIDPEWDVWRCTTGQGCTYLGCWWFCPAEKK